MKWNGSNDNITNILKNSAKKIKYCHSRIYAPQLTCCLQGIADSFIKKLILRIFMQYLDKVLDILDYMSIKFNVASKEPIYFIKKLAEKVHIGYSLLIDKIGYSGRVFSFREGKVLN